MPRWQLHDPVAVQTYVFEHSPNKAQPINLEFNTITGASLRPGVGFARRSLPVPKDWSFSGFYSTQAHHDALLAWSQRNVQLELTDHFGRVFSILIKSFVPTERPPDHPSKTGASEWRGTYQMNCLMIGRIA